MKIEFLNIGHYYIKYNFFVINRVYLCLSLSLGFCYASLSSVCKLSGFIQTVDGPRKSVHLKLTDFRVWKVVEKDLSPGKPMKSPGGYDMAVLKFCRGKCLV